MRRTLTLKAQFGAMLGVIVLAAMSMALFAALILRHWLIKERIDGLHQVLQAARHVVAAEADRAGTDVASGQRRALEVLSHMRFGSSGYISVFDGNYRLLLNPAQPGKIGHNVRDVVSPDGVHQFRELAAIARSGGRGQVAFQWHRPGETRVEAKRASAIAFGPWGWVLSAGVYTSDIEAQFWAAFRVFLIAVAAVGGVVMTAALLIMRSIRRGLGGEPSELKRVARQLAAGEWNHPVREQTCEDSALGQVHAMRQRLEGVLGQVRHSSEAMTMAAEQIAQGNDDLSRRTRNQAASLQQQATSLGQLATTIRRNAESTAQADRLSRDAQASAERGREVISRAIEAMHAIDTASGRIGEIVGLIDEIAFQTNLLALNASVEAARAGEHGRGFAVVASEVRQLAQRSAAAARDIRGLISDSAGKVLAGTELVGQSGDALASILDNVRRLAAIVAGITAAGADQATGIEQLDGAMASMDDATRQNAELVEQVAAASRAMEQQAGSLLKQLAYFSLSDESSASAAEAAG